MSAAETLKSGARIKTTAKLIAGRYELREALGEGGMGVVYRAIDTRTGGYAAIKTMRDVSDPRTLAMFKNEWATLARLSHPNIVDIRDVEEFEENGIRKPCFIMPLLPGLTLAALIKDSSQRLTVDRVVNIICQVCSGLEAAHRNKIIHRDMKPSNIFVMEDDTTKIIDFGLVHSAEARSVTGYKGTWQYMAPEQTLGEQPTPLSDIFSLGVVTYEALTTRKPFARPTVQETVQAVRTYIPPVISEINPKVTQLVSKVVHKAMAKQSMHRYASAREFSETLQSAFRNQHIERFDLARIQPRIERARKAFTKDDDAFASEILSELEAEGNVDPEITLLRAQIEEARKQKRIRSLFEAAQTRLEQEEIPLALDKLREILTLDPENADALAMRKHIEEQRNNQQISDWMKLAHQHLQLGDFAEARHALKEVLNIRYDDSDALALYAQVDVQEREATKARADKEQLYGSALKAYQGGELSIALSKLEKILEVSRRTPGATVPERDAVYQSFYNRVRTERDSIDKGYEDGRRALNEKDFLKTFEICNQMLDSYPNSAQFQALKLKAEQAERQELSAYIAEIGRSVDSEPDLDRRVNILAEACKRYPNEAQFQQSFRLVREQRDLAHSILNKARQYEEQNQFSDAIGQWKILRNIHPQYPAIDFEISQLEKRREQQAAEEKKARFVEQIDRAMENALFRNAVQFAAEALEDFPQDSELIVLEKFARQGLERTQEAERLSEEARKSRSEKNYEQATELLHEALTLDDRNLGIRNALVSLLVERAHACLDKDWQKAEPLVQSAAELDPQHPAVKRLQTLITEARRRDSVTQCLADARELQATGGIPAALTCVEDGLSRYPGDPKLLNHRNTLENLKKQQKDVKPERTADVPEQPKTMAAVVSPNSGLTELYDKSRSYPESPLSEPERSRIITIPHDVLKEVKAPEPLTREKEPDHPIEPFWHPYWERLKASKLLELKTTRFWWIVTMSAATLLCLLGFLLTKRTHPEHKAPTPTVIQPAATIRTHPSDATVLVDGKSYSDGSLLSDTSKAHEVTVSRLGYKPQHLTGYGPNQNWSFILQPEPVHIEVLTPERNAKIYLDGKEIWNLQSGDLTSYDLVPDGGRHTLSGRKQSGDIFRISFDAPVAASPRIAPFNTPDVVAAASFNESVPTLSVSLRANPNFGTLIITSNTPNAQLFFDGKGKMTRRAGLWRVTAPAGRHEIRLTANGFAEEVRSVQIEKAKDFTQTIDLSAASATLLVEGGTPGAELSIDNSTSTNLDANGGAHVSVAPGQHRLDLRKENFESLTLNKTFTAGQSLKLQPKDVVLREYGTLAFDIEPQSALVEYKRPDEGDWHAGSPHGSIRLKAGTYTVRAQAESYKPAYRMAELIPGEVRKAGLVLERIPDPVILQQPLYLHPEQLKRMQGNWSTSDEEFLQLRGSRFTFTFLKPDRIPGKKRSKRFGWNVSLLPDGEISYELDAQQLTRKVRLNGKVVKDSKKTDTAHGDGMFSVILTVVAHRIRVTKLDGTLIDEFDDDAHDWSHAVAAIRGDQYFTVH